MKAKYQILTLGIAGIVTCIGATNASGLTYQSSVTNSFTINESVSIELSSDELKIDNLTPGQSADSNVITITTESNAGKFTLSSTVGNSTYNTTDLVQSDVDDKFSILSSSGDLGFGEWGFKLSTKTGDNNEWTDWSPSYSGLPIYSDTTADPVNLVTDANAKTTVAFKIGAKASTSQAAGEYNNVINFIATASPTTTPSEVYIQDLDLASCQVNVGEGDNPANVGDELTVTDSRDGKEYTVRYINGACWMTQNLAIEPGTKMTEADTNITSAQYNNDTYYALPSTDHDLETNAASGGNCYGTGSSNTDYSGKGWTEACTHVATDANVSEAGSAACGGSACSKEQLGAWYNYAAATAGTIYGTSSDTAAQSTVDTYNICPKGWTLPVRNTSSPAGSTNSVVDYVASFNPLYGGDYDNGEHSGASRYGSWWSTTNGNVRGRWSLIYYDGSLDAADFGFRYNGLYVRCILAS